jgi:hypothetical protein
MLVQFGAENLDLAAEVGEPVIVDDARRYLGEPKPPMTRSSGSLERTKMEEGRRSLWRSPASVRE